MSSNPNNGTRKRVSCPSFSLNLEGGDVIEGVKIDPAKNSTKVSAQVDYSIAHKPRDRTRERANQ